MSGLAALVREEERRRAACWPAADRWRALQETIAWADAQQDVPRNSMRSCLARQRRPGPRNAAADPLATRCP